MSSFTLCPSFPNKLGLYSINCLSFPLKWLYLNYTERLPESITIFPSLRFVILVVKIRQTIHIVMKPSHITSLQIYKIPFAGGGVYGAGGVGYGASGTGILNLTKRHSFSYKLLEAYKASRHRGHHILTIPEKEKGKQKVSMT